jgi:hypothetical protein
VPPEALGVRQPQAVQILDVKLVRDLDMAVIGGDANRRHVADRHAAKLDRRADLQPLH